jgi:hypothetical protein
MGHIQGWSQTWLIPRGLTWMCFREKKRRKTLLVWLIWSCLEAVIGISVERKELWSVEEIERSCSRICGVEIRDFGFVEKTRVLEVPLW